MSFPLLVWTARSAIEEVNPALERIARTLGAASGAWLSPSPCRSQDAVCWRGHSWRSRARWANSARPSWWPATSPASPPRYRRHLPTRATRRGQPCLDDGGHLAGAGVCGALEQRLAPAPRKNTDMSLLLKDITLRSLPSRSKWMWKSTDASPPSSVLWRGQNFAARTGGRTPPRQIRLHPARRPGAD